MSRDTSADPFHTDAATLSHYSDSRDNANRLMDDLELLRVERQVSNAEKEKENASRRRSRSQQHHHQDRHKPEAPPEDAFHTLTEPAQLPQISGGPEPTALGKLFKKLRRFPRVVRYFVYVCSLHLVLLCYAYIPRIRLLLYYPVLTSALQRLYRWRSFF